jgi:hypothetical protein
VNPELHWQIDQLVARMRQVAELLDAEDQKLPARYLARVIDQLLALQREEW